MAAGGGGGGRGGSAPRWGGGGRAAAQEKLPVHVSAERGPPGFVRVPAEGGGERPCPPRRDPPRPGPAPNPPPGPRGAPLPPHELSTPLCLTALLLCKSNTMNK